MKTKTDHLINELVTQLKTVHVVKFPFSDLLKVVASGLLCVFAAVAILGLRFDIQNQILTARFLVDTFLLFLLGVLSIMAAFSLSIPSTKSRNIYRFPLFVFGLILAATCYSFLTASNPFLYLGHGFLCVFEMISIGAIPAAILFYFIRQAAVLKRDLVGILILMGGISFGLLGTQFTCFDSSSMHILLWHLLPSVVLLILGIFLARKVFNAI